MSDQLADLAANRLANCVIDECESTNDLARILGEKGYPHGTWVSTRRQLRGRGRLGRSWQSEEQNLFLSMVLRMEEKSVWTWVPLAGAIGAANAITAHLPYVNLKIKWPNDLWIMKNGLGAKLGGILCEGIGSPAGAFIVLGLGLNCRSAPEGLDQRTISLTQAANREVTADEVRPAVVRGVLASVESLRQTGTAILIQEYSRFAALPPGTPIEWTSIQSSASSTEQGIVEGLGTFGELKVRDPSGRLIKLYAEDVRVRPKAAHPEG